MEEISFSILKTEHICRYKSIPFCVAGERIIRYPLPCFILPGQLC